MSNRIIHYRLHVSRAPFSETAVGFELCNLSKREGEASSIKHMMLQTFQQTIRKEKNTFRLTFKAKRMKLIYSRNRGEHLWFGDGILTRGVRLPPGVSPSTSL